MVHIRLVLHLNKNVRHWYSFTLEKKFYIGPIYTSVKKLDLSSVYTKFKKVDVSTFCTRLKKNRHRSALN